MYNIGKGKHVNVSRFAHILHGLLVQKFMFENSENICPYFFSHDSNDRLKGLERFGCFMFWSHITSSVETGLWQ